MTGENLSDGRRLSRKVGVALKEENCFYLSCGDLYVIGDKGFYQIAFV